MLLMLDRNRLWQRDPFTGLDIGGDTGSWRSNYDAGDDIISSGDNTGIDGDAGTGTGRGDNGKGMDITDDTDMVNDADTCTGMGDADNGGATCGDTGAGDTAGTGTNGHWQ